MKCDVHAIEMEYKGEGSFIGQDIWECYMCNAEDDAEYQLQEWMENHPEDFDQGDDDDYNVLGDDGKQVWFPTEYG